MAGEAIPSPGANEFFSEIQPACRTDFCNRPRKYDGMRTRKAGPGRKSKGPRKAYRPQLPADVHARVEHEAALRDLPLSEYVALCLAQFHGMTVEMPPPLRALEVFDVAPKEPTGDEALHVMTRVPTPLANVIERECQARQDMARSHYIALAVALAHGFDVELPARSEDANDELDLGLEVAIGA